MRIKFKVRPDLARKCFTRYKQNIPFSWNYHAIWHKFQNVEKKRKINLFISLGLICSGRGIVVVFSKIKIPTFVWMKIKEMPIKRLWIYFFWIEIWWWFLQVFEERSTQWWENNLYFWREKKEIWSLYYFYDPLLFQTISMFVSADIVHCKKCYNFFSFFRKNDFEWNILFM